MVTPVILDWQLLLFALALNSIYYYINYVSLHELLTYVILYYSYLVNMDMHTTYPANAQCYNNVASRLW